MNLTPEQAQYLLVVLDAQADIARDYYGLEPTAKHEDLKAVLRKIADPPVCTCTISAQTGKRRPTRGCRIHKTLDRHVF